MTQDKFAYILRKKGTGEFFTCGGYESPVFMHLMSAWTFPSVSSATEAARLIFERSKLQTALQVYRMPDMEGVFKSDGADSQDIDDLITAIDKQCTKVFPLPYERYGKLRDELMNARDRIQEALLQIGLGLLRDSVPIEEVAPSQVI